MTLGMHMHVGAPEEPRSLGDALAAVARDAPRQAALHRVTFTRGAPAAVAVSHEELQGQVRHAIGQLTSLDVTRGDRIVLSLGDAAHFLSFFLAAQDLGAIPVPVPSARDLNRSACVERIRSILPDARPALAVLDDDQGATQIAGVSGTLKVHCTHPTEVAEGGACPPSTDGPRHEPGGIAFLQYTSGSTGTPKGVVVTHENLLSNIRAMIEHIELDAMDVMYSWLPLYHDMGLIGGLLMGLYGRIPVFIARPVSFLARPETWIRGIDAFKATLSPAPNFAFELAAGVRPSIPSASWDLSAWRLAFSGGETVFPESVAAFTERFSRHGWHETSFCPAYGLAEATLAVTLGAPGGGLRTDRVDLDVLSRTAVAAPANAHSACVREYASVGRPVVGCRVRIVSPDGSEGLPERHVGEVVIYGPCVSPGYFDELQSGRPIRHEVRSGDLGYMADGELYIVDRLKDILVLAGRNYVASDIEEKVKGTPGLHRDAVVAFSAETTLGTERLCLVAGLDRSARRPRAALAAEIRRRINHAFGVVPSAIFLVRPRDVPRTTSGKLRRAECRARMASGAFGAWE